MTMTHFTTDDGARITLEPISTTIKRARDLVARPFGWIKGQYSKGVEIEAEGDEMETTIDAFCSVGAINEAIFNSKALDGSNVFTAGEGDEVYHKIVNLRLDRKADVYGYVRRAGAPEGDLVNWNDAPERSQDEVIALFDNALALAKRDEEPLPTN